MNKNKLNVRKIKCIGECKNTNYLDPITLLSFKNDNHQKKNCPTKNYLDENNNLMRSRFCDSKDNISNKDLNKY